VTKPGNSDPDEVENADAAEPAPAEESTKDTEATAPEPEPAADEDSEPAEDTTAAAEPDDTEKSEKSEDAAADEDSGEDSDAKGHDLMSELEKAPPAPEEPPAKPRKREKPVMPTAAEADASRPEMTTPKAVKYAFYVFATAAAVWVANAIIWLVNKDAVTKQAIETFQQQKDGPKVTEQQIAEFTNFLLWATFILALVFGSLYVLFGYKAQDGLRRARILLTILAVISVLFHYWFFQTPIGLLSALLALVGTVLLYTPRSSAYFRAHQGT
jgi:hypothetical protein